MSLTSVEILFHPYQMSGWPRWVFIKMNSSPQTKQQMTTNMKKVPASTRDHTPTTDDFCLFCRRVLLSLFSCPSLWRRSVDIPLIRLTENQSNLVRAAALKADTLTSWLLEDVKVHGCVRFTRVRRNNCISWGSSEHRRPDKGPVGRLFSC